MAYLDTQHSWSLKVKIVFNQVLRLNISGVVSGFLKIGNWVSHRDFGKYYYCHGFGMVRFIKFM